MLAAAAYFGVARGNSRPLFAFVCQEGGVSCLGRESWAVLLKFCVLELVWAPDFGLDWLFWLFGLHLAEGEKWAPAMKTANSNQFPHFLGF